MKRVLSFVAAALLLSACEHQKEIPEANAYFCLQNLDSTHTVEMRAVQAVHGLYDTTYVLFAEPLTEELIQVIPSHYAVDFYVNGIDLDRSCIPHVEPFDTMYFEVKVPKSFN